MNRGSRLVGALVGAIVAASAALAVFAPPASAHADLEETSPAREAIVSSPTAVRIRFEDPVQLTGTGLQVRTEAGALVASEPTSAPSTVFSVALPKHMANGIYAVGFVFRSSDGHVDADSYRFRVRGTSSTSDGPSLLLPLVAVGAALMLAGCWLLARRSKRLGASMALLVVAGAAVIVVAERSSDRPSRPAVAVQVSPARVGLTTVTLLLPDGLKRADTTDLHLVQDGSKLSVHVALGLDGPGRWVAHDVDLPLAGHWRAEVSVVTKSTQVLADTSVEVAAH
jgi:methionine-rich copper-binding protein CopC